MIAALAVVYAMLAVSRQGRRLYVATDGTIATGELAPSPGSGDGPFATLEGDAIRKQKQ